jgi:3-methyl-2-oxobutanoate hydroxymethyltransferase
MEIPVIGIGAGADCDGQVLVFHDLLGIFGGHAAKFVKRYADVRGEMVRGVAAYAREVRSGAFPGPEHIYSIDPAELGGFRAYLDQESLASADWDWSATEI